MLFDFNWNSLLLTDMNIIYILCLLTNSLFDFLNISLSSDDVSSLPPSIFKEMQLDLTVRGLLATYCVMWRVRRHQPKLTD